MVQLKNISTADSSTVHVNGQNEKPTDETNNEVKPAEETTSTEKPSQVEPTVSSTETEPVSSTPVDTANEGSSSVPTSTVDTAPPPAVETTTTNDNVPEVSVATEAGTTTEVKSKSSRAKAKAPVVPITPTRQSTRARKPASSSNVEENQTIDDTVATNQNDSSKRTKRQAATIDKDVIQPNPPSDISIANDVNKQDVIPSHSDEEKVSPSPSKKRGASTLTTNTTKKAKGKTSITPTSDVDNEAIPNEDEIIQTPPKKARTSANKKTPEPPSEEYVRKLRPRK